MVSNINPKDYDRVNELGLKLNNNFIKLFHIDNLSDNEHILVYKENNLIVGFIHYNVSYEIADLLNIIVDDNYQNKGIATNLINGMIDNLPEEAQKIMLEVNENNIKAINLYLKNGFKEINRRKNYYNNADAIIMERNLK